jgi:hypothetical protein
VVKAADFFQPAGAPVRALGVSGVVGEVMEASYPFVPVV